MIDTNRIADLETRLVCQQQQKEIDGLRSEVQRLIALLEIKLGRKL